MKLLLTLLLTVSLYGDKLLNELKNLSPDQKAVLYKTFEKGKALDLHYTLTAIAWQESSFGKFKIGRWSADYGVFQINIRTWKSRYSKEIKQYGLTNEKIKKYLVEHYDLGFVAAVDEILFWKTVHGNNWNKIWASYNDGTHISAKGHKYSKLIGKKVRAIKKFLSEDKRI